MTEKLTEAGFLWTFKTEDENLAACPICGETEITRQDSFRDGAVVTTRRAARVYFKCGHVFTGLKIIPPQSPG